MTFFFFSLLFDFEKLSRDLDAVTLPVWHAHSKQITCVVNK